MFGNIWSACSIDSFVNLRVIGPVDSAQWQAYRIGLTIWQSDGMVPLKSNIPRTTSRTAAGACVQGASSTRISDIQRSVACRLSNAEDEDVIVAGDLRPRVQKFRRPCRTLYFIYVSMYRI